MRNVTTFNFNHAFDGGGVLNIKQSLAFFDRETQTPSVFFKGTQFNSYTDVSFLRMFGRHALVVGGTAVVDHFREDTLGETRAPRNEDRPSVGFYVQDTVDLSDKFSAQMGLRIDRTGSHGTFVLPRVSLLYRFTDALSARAGFGLGYKTPTMFTEDSERLLFENVAPIGETVSAERSRGGTFDINYEGKFGGSITYSLNQMFFYTLISDPLILRPYDGGIYRFSNAASPIISKGFETNARVAYGIAKLFIGYTFTDAKAGYLSGDRVIPLLPKSKINASFVLERHEDFKTGVEFHFTGRQTLEDRTTTRSFAVVGLFGEKTFGNFSLFINAENITDVRQSRYGQVVFPPYDSPMFADIYMHTEGRIINGGIKLRF
jgi:iron complex outermembrane receptor protein/outer membrane receptor for ferrienterochelin and colicins